MIEHGHVDAWRYPIGKVWEEHALIAERINRDYATNATILQAVMTAAVASFGKKGRDASKALNDLIKELGDNG